MTRPAGSTRAGGPRRREKPRSGMRGLYVGIALAAVLFLVAQVYRPAKHPVPTLPEPSAINVVLGRPTPTTAFARVGQLLAVQVPPGTGLRYETKLSHPADDPIVDVQSTLMDPPVLRGLRPGTVLVTVLLAPRCEDQAACLEYRRDLGAIRVTITG